MAFPPLCTLTDPSDYRQRFESMYCNAPITTFDGIEVRFRKNQFDHCFFESSNRNGVKDQFSVGRAERIDWIKAALEDATAARYAGWDKQKKRYDQTRRVCIVMVNYVVVIAIKKNRKADFITAYVADTPSTLQKLNTSPPWTG